MNIKKSNLCANCGAPNHIYKNCNNPITSFGIICIRFTIVDCCVQPQYLMVQRKDSLSYSTFIRGKYKVESRKYIMELFENMTESERSDLKTKDFESLWKNLWKVTECNSFLREYEDAKAKFDTLKCGIHCRGLDKNPIFDIVYILNNTKPKFDETEWGFPKGRRNINEDDCRCAMREFVEETSIPNESINVIGTDPFHETFIGGNKLKYKHVYYLCQLNDSNYMDDKTLEPVTLMQQREIQKVEWFSYEEAQSKIRISNNERKDLLKFINASVMNFPLSFIQINV